MKIVMSIEFTNFW